jgi:hypothetical protein
MTEKGRAYHRRVRGNRHNICPAGGDQLSMPIGQLDNDLRFIICVDMSDNFQRLVVQGVVRSGDPDALYVSVIQ